MTNAKTSAKPQSFLAFEKERLVKLYNFIKGIKTKDPKKEISPISLAIKSYKNIAPQCRSIFRKCALSSFLSGVAEGLIPITSMYVYNSLPAVATGSKNAVLIFILFYCIYKLRDVVGEFLIGKMHQNSQKLSEAIVSTNLASNYIDITNKPRAFFTINNPATLSSTSLRLNTAIYNILRDTVGIIREFIIILIALYGLFIVSAKFVVLFLFVSWLYIEISTYMQEIKRVITQKKSIIKSHVDKQNRDALQNSPLIQDALSQKREYKMILSRNNKSFNTCIKEIYINIMNEAYLRIVADLIFSAIVGVYAIYDIIETKDIGRFALIVTATNSVRMRFRGYAYLYISVMSARNNYLDADKLLATPRALELKTGSKKLTSKDNVINIKDIRFSYPKIKDITTFGAEKETIERGNEVIKGITTTINPGEITVVAGTSGEGKTTLMSLIRHDYDLTSGSIKLGTKTLTSLSDNEINKQIAFIDQNVHFFDQTLLYNLKYFKQNASQEELKKALDSAGLTEDISNLKDGLYHRIGQDGRALSGGQRQRLALARIFLTDRPIMILDEPTTGLDQVLSFKIMKTLKEKAKDKTVLLVTHNPTEIALADRVIIIKNGKIESDGTPLELIETSPFLKSSLTKQDILSKQKLFSKIS
jgi:ABC-type multidrug transport system fused ATPase/permease subunit